MAAYIVERVSGQNFNDYVEEHIFKPLDMNNSTFHQPLPDALKTSMSNGYILGSGDPKPFELFQVAPAGALSSICSGYDAFHDHAFTKWTVRERASPKARNSNANACKTGRMAEINECDVFRVL